MRAILFTLLVVNPILAAEPIAVEVRDQPLRHTSQRFGRDLGELFDELKLDRPVKLNVVGVDRAAIESAQRTIAKRFPQNRPAVSYVVGKLPIANATLALDAVVLGGSGLGTLKPGSRVYVSGQAEKGANVAEATRKTLASLKQTLDWLGCSLRDVVQVKSFLKPITAVEDVRRECESLFGKDAVPPLVFVEWESTLPIEIELIAAVPKSSTLNLPAIEFLTPPGMSASPVFCRVTKVNTPETIFLDGIVAKASGTGAEEVLDVFRQFDTLLKSSGSDFRHLAKATYYVSANEASSKLNELRPKFYDPKRPPAASKAMVAGVGFTERTLAIDLIAVRAR